MWRLITLPKLKEVRKAGWDIDQDNLDLRWREDQIKTWRTAGIVVSVTSKDDQLKHPGLQLRHNPDMYSEHEFAAEISGSVNQIKQPR